MTLERIEKHITEQAEAEAAEIIDGARKEAERISSSAREEADAQYAGDIERLKRELRTAFEQDTGKLRARRRMELLKLKAGILDDVFANAAEKLLARDEYRDRVRSQLKEVAGSEGQILCRPDQRETIGGLLKELGGELTEKIAPLGEEGVDITGGFVFRGDRFDIDYSLDSQLDGLRENVLPELIAEAFPEE